MTPSFSIYSRKKDKEYAQDLAPILLDLTVIDQSNEEADAFSLTVSDVGNKIALPEEGAIVEIAVGFDGRLQTLGSFAIDELVLAGPPDTITISGKSAAFTDAEKWTAMKTRKSRSWDDIGIGDLVRGIAGEHGVEAVVAPDLAAITLPHLDQTDESDLNLLTRLARRHAAIFKPTHGKLVFVRGNGVTASGAEMGGVTITRGPGMRYTARLLSRTTFKQAKAKYHDNKTGKTEEVEVSPEMADAIEEAREEQGASDG